MKFGKALFAWFGRFARKEAGPDTFDLRLQRIRLRERVRKSASVLFRN